MLDIVFSAWQSVTRHRLRSLLAMAGVAVGVCALTSIMSVEKSWRQAVTDPLQWTGWAQVLRLGAK